MITFSPDGPKLVMVFHAELTLLNLKMPNAYRSTVGWLIDATQELFKVSSNTIQIGVNEWLADEDSAIVIPRLAVVSVHELIAGTMLYHHSNDMPKDDNGSPRTVN